MSLRLSGRVLRVGSSGDARTCWNIPRVPIHVPPPLPERRVMPARRCQEESPGSGLMGSETSPVICTWMWLQRLLIAVTELISQPARGHLRSDPPEWEVCFRWSSRRRGHPQVCSGVLPGLTHPTPPFSCSSLRLEGRGWRSWSGGWGGRAREGRQAWLLCCVPGLCWVLCREPMEHQ